MIKFEFLNLTGFRQIHWCLNLILLACFQQWMLQGSLHCACHTECCIHCFPQWMLQHRVCCGTLFSMVHNVLSTVNNLTAVCCAMCMPSIYHWKSAKLHKILPLYESVQILPFYESQILQNKKMFCDPHRPPLPSSKKNLYAGLNIFTFD